MDNLISAIRGHTTTCEAPTMTDAIDGFVHSLWLQLPHSMGCVGGVADLQSIKQWQNDRDLHKYFQFPTRLQVVIHWTDQMSEQRVSE